MGKKIVKILCWTLCIALVAGALWFLCAFFGNPVSSALAKSSTKRYLEENFPDRDFQVAKVGYNLKTGGYYAHIESPTSQDSHFTIYFDGLGRYQYDSYAGITDGSNTFARVSAEYRELADSVLADTPFDISIAFGDLRAGGYYDIFSYTNAAGEVKEYTFWKDYGLDMSTLTLDAEYDIRELGRSHGTLCVYLHDPEVSVERAAELLLEFKTYMDEQGLPFHAIDFHLCEPRNAEGQNAGEQITLFEFLYSDIYEEGLLDRVQLYWNIAREHHAIQDGEKVNSELEFLEEFEIPQD